jgi:carbon-monoxide dehydrogenase small subunit
MSSRIALSVTVNGEAISAFVEPRTSLADFLRDELRLTGTHLGCEMGACGACLVLLNGRAIHSCLMYAVQAEGQTIQTIEGLSESGAIASIQKAFHERNAAQCGFCTSGMLVTAYEVLKTCPDPTREEIRSALSGNYCRCTGYEAIVDAIQQAARMPDEPSRSDQTRTLQ